MAITASKLRDNVYRILDEVIETGAPVEVTRRGRTIRIVADKPTGRLDRLHRRAGYLRVDPEEIVHIDWSGEWRP